MGFFCTKYNTDGSVARYIACLVAKEYHQIEGFDFGETFNLVVKKLTIRVILTLIVTYKWSLHQMYVKNAFLSHL